MKQNEENGIESGGARGGHVTVISRFVRLYEEIIHKFKRAHYLPYGRINHGITVLYQPFQLYHSHLAQYEIFRAKLCYFLQGLYSI